MVSLCTCVVSQKHQRKRLKHLLQRKVMFTYYIDNLLITKWQNDWYWGSCIILLLKFFFYFSYTEAVAPKEKPKPAILAKGACGAYFYAQRNTNLTIQAACKSLFSWQNNKVLLEMPHWWKRGLKLCLWRNTFTLCYTDFRFLHPTVPNDILRNLMSVLCSSVVKMPKEKVKAVSAKTSTYSISCQRSEF